MKRYKWLRDIFGCVPVIFQILYQTINILFIPFSNRVKSLAFFPPDGSATASHLSISIDVAGACVLSCTGKHMFANKHMLAVFVPKKEKNNIYEFAIRRSSALWGKTRPEPE